MTRDNKKLIVVFVMAIVIMVAIGAFDNTEVGAVDDETPEPILDCPQDGLVKHPCRNPDALIRVKLSHYWPPLGGPNCFAFNEITKECVSGMSSGLPWQDWIGKAAACPSSLPFGTIVEFKNRRFICLDRGGAIVEDGGAYWIDTLTEYPLGDYGSEEIASVWYPMWYLLGTR